MKGASGKRSLQEVLRERRTAPRLLSPVEVSQREAARRREAVEAAAAEALGRWRDGESPDAQGRPDGAVYARLFASSSAAYYATRHWARRARAQLALAPACEVVACGSLADVAAHHLTHAALGAEEPGRDLVTLCDGCHRRARKLGRDRSRAPSRAEIVALDPAARLYDAADIAALKSRYAT